MIRGIGVVVGFGGYRVFLVVISGFCWLLVDFGGFVIYKSWF